MKIILNELELECLTTEILKRKAPKITKALPQIYQNGLKECEQSLQE